MTPDLPLAPPAVFGALRSAVANNEDLTDYLHECLGYQDTAHYLRALLARERAQLFTVPASYMMQAHSLDPGTGREMTLALRQRAVRSTARVWCRLPLQTYTEIRYRVAEHVLTSGVAMNHLVIKRQTRDRLPRALRRNQADVLKYGSTAQIVDVYRDYFDRDHAERTVDHLRACCQTLSTLSTLSTFGDRSEVSTDWIVEPDKICSIKQYVVYTLDNLTNSASRELQARLDAGFRQGAIQALTNTIIGKAPA